MKPLRLLLGILACGALWAADRDPKAEEIGKAMMQAMGGENAWKAVHYIRYDFKVSKEGKALSERSHLWDKWGGRYRLESKKEGKSELVLFSNINKKEGGAAYRDGRKVEGAEADKLILNAYGAWINDMYWLTMPWKWMDDGVKLKYLGPKTRGGETYDVVELTFGKVGMTPGDMYNAYVSQKTHMMEHWEYTLQSKQKGSWDWRWGDAGGGVKLPMDHTNDQKMSINMGAARVLAKVDDAFFTDAGHDLAQLK